MSDEAISMILSVIIEVALIVYSEIHSGPRRDPLVRVARFLKRVGGK